MQRWKIVDELTYMLPGLLIHIPLLTTRLPLSIPRESKSVLSKIRNSSLQNKPDNALRTYSSLALLQRHSST